MNKKITLLLFVVLLAVSLITAACGPAAASAEPTPVVSTPPPFKGEVVVQYNYEGVPQQWLRNLPEAVTMEVRYAEGWWDPIKFEMSEYEGVTLFGLEVDPPNSIAGHDENGDRVYTILGGCYWEWMGSVENVVWYEFRDCSQVEAGTVIPATVTLAYCTSFKEGLLCLKEGLSVFIAENYITFTAEEIFLPQYREWVREVLSYLGGGELPLVLQPNYSYTILLDK